MSYFSLSETLATLPSEPSESHLPEIRRRLRQSDRVIVVLDDDPTGTQTVHDTPVITSWSTEAIQTEIERGSRLFYILTNSRSLPEAEATQLAQEIGENLLQASESAGKTITVISRSDSTLRGHYPAEVDALASAMQVSGAPQIIMPFFLQGGRLTINDEHYVVDQDDLVPASETPFAQDAAFGFRNSNLIDWVVEKCDGQTKRDDVIAISLGELRGNDNDAVANRLKNLTRGQVCVVNAVSMRDVESFVLAALKAESSGCQFVYRTAASFVQSFAGLEPKELLQTNEMVDASASAGLIVVGSYVPKTTAQLRVLTEHGENLKAIELSMDDVLSQDIDQRIRDITNQVNEALRSGVHVVLHTSRELIRGADAADSLRIGNRTSAALVEIVRLIEPSLRFLIAKGGITSSDVGTQGLGIQRAIVLGQILPGVPVWQTQDESRRPGLPYVIFPGNVGDDEALLKAFERLT